MYTFFFECDTQNRRSNNEPEITTRWHIHNETDVRCLCREIDIDELIIFVAVLWQVQSQCMLTTYRDIVAFIYFVFI